MYTISVRALLALLARGRGPYHRSGDVTPWAGLGAVRGHAWSLIPYVIYTPGFCPVAGARGTCVNANYDTHYGGQVGYTGCGDRLDDRGRQQGEFGLVEVQGLIGEGGGIRTLEGREEELLKEHRHSLLDLWADRRGAMQVNVDWPRSRRAWALVVLTAEGILGPFDRRQLEGYPQARGTSHVTDGQHNPGHSRDPRPVVAVRGFPGEPDCTEEDSWFIPRVQVHPVKLPVNPGPQRRAIMCPNLQKVGESLVEADIQDRGAPLAEGADLGEGRRRIPQGA